MKTIRSLGAVTALATAAVAAPVSAAQIVLNAGMIIGSGGSPYAAPAPALDQQTGQVSKTAANAWDGGFGGRMILDLGQAYDFSRFDIFTIDDIVVNVTGANQIIFTPFVGYDVTGPLTNLGSLTGTPDAGDANGALIAQSQTVSDANHFRYLAIAVSGPVGSRSNVLNEIRLYDRAEPLPGGGGVPEPATWALMIGGFGLAGSALRRRRPALA